MFRVGFTCDVAPVTPREYGEHPALRSAQYLRLEFWVMGLEFWVSGFGFWILGFGFWALVLGFWGLRFRVWGLGV